ncbi:MAG TPA: 2-phosphosulfolactate phosphatase [Dongiaceae bacterium]|jgi:2-phosphosulfolactate phosphatase|nr:2-phosphosulfolactate phosphatase [Dongiaceae bacterium]
MEIRIESLLEGAARARGGAVAVIDVFRAFTSAAVALAEGAERIIMVGTVEEAQMLRAQGAGQLCIGEVGGKAPPGFDFGNSPVEILEGSRRGAAFGGKTVIQRTGAGTQGIVAAQANADRLYAASLVTAIATARALTSTGIELISLLAMGNRAIERTDEDEICALHLRNLLQGRPGDAAAVRNLILAGGEIADFRDPERPRLNPGDLDIALDIDRYHFAIAVVMENGRAVAKKG